MEIIKRNMDMSHATGNCTVRLLNAGIIPSKASKKEKITPNKLSLNQHAVGPQKQDFMTLTLLYHSANR
ncbi:MAG: hypothetical protein NTU61_00960 [Candidatus Altiarchaeota archaeon]|nr:hypothetical protein [Candidatus Altiarchaeota archaeon]